MGVVLHQDGDEPPKASTQGCGRDATGAAGLFTEHTRSPTNAARDAVTRVGADRAPAMRTAVAEIQLA